MNIPIAPTDGLVRQIPCGQNCPQVQARRFYQVYVL